MGLDSIYSERCILTVLFTSKSVYLCVHLCVWERERGEREREREYCLNAGLYEGQKNTLDFLKQEGQSLWINQYGYYKLNSGFWRGNKYSQEGVISLLPLIHFQCTLSLHVLKKKLSTEYLDFLKHAIKTLLPVP